jgi:hypothetical protein
MTHLPQNHAAGRNMRNAKWLATEWESISESPGVATLGLRFLPCPGKTQRRRGGRDSAAAAFWDTVETASLVVSPHVTENPKSQIRNPKKDRIINRFLLGRLRLFRISKFQIWNFLLSGP